MKLRLLAMLLPLAIGCHAQIPPTNHTVALTWTAPASGCATGCTYVLSRAPATGSTCPATTGTAYLQLNQAAPSTGTAYTDTTAAGQNVCYIAQTLQGSAVSVPSNTAGPIFVPANPLAPSLGTPTESMLAEPAPRPTELAQANVQPTSLRIRK